MKVAAALVAVVFTLLASSKILNIKLFIYFLILDIK